ncbi:MAG: hypothetical protein ACI8P0_006599 [Planctomycetaceae bacterium]|jgi:hypothetical protein
MPHQCRTNAKSDCPPHVTTLHKNGVTPPPVIGETNINVLTLNANMDRGWPRLLATGAAEPHEVFFGAGCLKTFLSLRDPDGKQSRTLAQDEINELQR